MNMSLKAEISVEWSVVIAFFIISKLQFVGPDLIRLVAWQMAEYKALTVGV